jgi:hypothetical protein
VRVGLPIRIDGVVWVRIFEGQITAINAAISNQLSQTGHVVLIGI